MKQSESSNIWLLNVICTLYRSQRMILHSSKSPCLRCGTRLNCNYCFIMLLVPQNQRERWRGSAVEQTNSTRSGTVSEHFIEYHHRKWRSDWSALREVKHDSGRETQVEEIKVDKVPWEESQLIVEAWDYLEAIEKNRTCNTFETILHSFGFPALTSSQAGVNAYEVFSIPVKNHESLYVICRSKVERSVKCYHIISHTWTKPSMVS